MAETAISQDLRYRARPTVRVDEQERDRVSDRINSFRVVEHEGGLSSLELHLTNFANEEGRQEATFSFEDERDLALGSRIALYSGDERRPREVFRGVVTGLESEFPEDGPAELVVLAEDVLQRGRMARRTKVHEPARLSTIANDLAQRLSLTPKVTGLTDDQGVQVQLNESDLAFLRRLLDRVDGDLQVVGRELHVSPRRDVKRGTVELSLGGQLRSARFVVDLAHQVTEVTTSGWDPIAGKRVSSTSRGSALGPGRGRTGARLVDDKLGARSEHVGYPPVTTDAEARALAHAAFDRRARRFVVVEATAEGNPTLRVGTHVSIRGTSKRFENTYYIVRACHRFDLERGYETDFEGECAYLGDP
jgi:phage protein D